MRLKDQLPVFVVDIDDSPVDQIYEGDEMITQVLISGKADYNRDLTTDQ